ncbi:MAG: TetR/AcrR family transcriptional regulator, partial [Planococcus sp. (in: Bacteria)]|nr:TetR/AcrR family transcriptional regulator [Planococcus sp. (in: firmicutes)]
MAVYDDMNEKTKEKIQKSFLQLLQEKNFIKVSVQDIAKASGINRGTFYLHYLDKYDLLD